MSESATRKRDVSLDITRIIAFVSVPAIHFFLNSGYYNVPLEGKRMYLMTYGRTFFMVCVPLFMILSGYLMVTKDIKLEKKSILKFYSKLSKVLVTYLLAALAIIIYKVYFLKEPLSVQDGIFNILGYKQYAWYVNMYIGCYLLVPLLNALWKAADTKHGHFCIVIILCVLTVAPSIFNVYDFLTPDALIKPWLSVSYNQIVPNWWSSLYPVTYYCIGAYLRTDIDVKKLKTWKILLLLICSVAIFGTYNIWRSYSIKFVWGPWCDWGSLQNTVNATLVFLLINSISIPSPNVIVGKAIKLISDLTFGAYIISWIPDQIYYSKLAEAVPDIHLRGNYFPIVVGKVVVFALAVSFGIYLIIKLFSKIYCLLKLKWNGKNNNCSV